MDFDLFQRFRSNQASNSAGAADVKASEGLTEIRDLKNRVDHLALVTQAMCELLEQVGFDNKALEDKVREIQLRDERSTGAYRNTKKCAGCNRVVSKNHVRCVYCGGQL